MKVTSQIFRYTVDTAQWICNGWQAKESRWVGNQKHPVLKAYPSSWAQWQEDKRKVNNKTSFFTHKNKPFENFWGTKVTVMDQMFTLDCSSFINTRSSLEKMNHQRQVSQTAIFSLREPLTPTLPIPHCPRASTPLGPQVKCLLRPGMNSCHKHRMGSRTS